MGVVNCAMFNSIATMIPSGAMIDMKKDSLIECYSYAHVMKYIAIPSVKAYL